MHYSIGTFVFMAINFLILVFILTKMLYHPIQGILEERRAKISKDLSEADQSRQTYEKLSGEVKETLEKARAEAHSIVENSRIQAEKLKEQILTEARQEAEQLRQRNQEEIERAKVSAREELRSGTITLALAATEKLIGDQMSKDINNILVGRVLDQIEKGAAGNVITGGA